MRKLLFAATSAIVLATTSASAQAVNWDKVDAAFGRKAAVTGDVHRYGFPRTDLTVTLDGVTIKPALALGGWLAFKPAHGGAMVMGDLVLLEAEINPVMTALIQNGLEITAIHNHVLRGNPATFYMHVGGHGDPEKMATAILQALRSARRRSRRPQHLRPSPRSISTPRSSIRSSAPRAMPTVASISSPCRAATRSRKAAWRLHPPGRWALRPRSTSSRPAAARRRSPAISCLTAEEVHAVIKELRANGIEVTAIHSHMLDEQPRLIFMHFWANDDAIKLAQGPARALDKTARAKS